MRAMKHSEHLLSSTAVRPRIHRRRSAQSVGVALASRLIVKNGVRVWSTQPNRNWGLEYVDSLAGLLPRFGTTAQTQRVRLDHCDAEWVRAQGVSSTRAILYLHGGAFLTCGLNTHRSLVTRLSREADAAVLNVGYRKMPSHGIADAISNRRERGHARCSPAGRCRCLLGVGSASVKGEMAAIPAGYLGDVVSPVDADLSDLPPVAIHARSDELLLPDAELMANRLGANGIRCDLHLWDGQIHDFPLAADILPEGRRALRYVGEFIKEVTDAQTASEQRAS